MQGKDRKETGWTSQTHGIGTFPTTSQTGMMQAKRKKQSKPRWRWLKRKLPRTRKNKTHRKWLVSVFLCLHHNFELCLELLDWARKKWPPLARNQELMCLKKCDSGSPNLASYFACRQVCENMAPQCLSKRWQIVAMWVDLSHCAAEGTKKMTKRVEDVHTSSDRDSELPSHFNRWMASLS